MVVSGGTGGESIGSQGSQLSQFSQFIHNTMPAFDGSLWSIFIICYAHVVLLGALYGLCSGVGEWIDWMNKRKRYVVSYNMINPILNAGRDAGMLAYHIITSAFVSAFIVGTYPISLPTLIFFAKAETDDEKASRGMDRFKCDDDSDDDSQ